MSSSNLSYIARLKSAPRYYAMGLYEEISTKNVFLFAQAIAFKVLVTIVPIIVLATGMMARVLLGSDNAFDAVAGFVREFLPAYQSGQLIEFLKELQLASGTLTAIGAVGLIVTAMTLATTVRIAIAGAFEQEWHKQRSILGGYVFDLRMVGQVGLLFLLSVALTIAVQALLSSGSAFIGAYLGFDFLQRGWKMALGTVGLLVPFMVTTAMFFQLFYFIPRPHPPKRSALIGALVTALFWEVAKYGFTLYAEYVGQFDRYGRSSVGDGLGGESGMAALGSGFGLIIAFVFWVYYSGIVLMLGAIVASLHERHRRIRQRERAEEALATAAAPGEKLDVAARERPATHGNGAPAEEDEEKKPDATAEKERSASPESPLAR